MPTTAYALQRCSVCRVEKPLHEFYRDSLRKLGRGSNCVSCTRGRYNPTAKRDYYQKNRAKKLIAMNWRNENKSAPPIVFDDCDHCGKPYISMIRLVTKIRSYCTEECAREARRNQRKTNQRKTNSLHRQNKRRTTKRYTDITRRRRTPYPQGQAMRIVQLLPNR